jgi:DNA polymerase-3 subunit delta
MSVFGRALLIVGAVAKDGADYLAERALGQALDAVRAADPECEITDIRAADLARGDFAGLTGPSLFSASSAVVVRALEDLADDVKDEFIALAATPAPDVAVVMLHGGGAKGKAVLDRLRASAALTEVKVTAPKYERDFVAWLREEFRGRGRRIDEEAALLLVASVGQDLRALAGAADQLVAVTSDSAAVSTEIVRRYFDGRANIKGYEIADATLDGRIDLAVERARWAMEARLDPLPIVSAVASGLRTLLKFATAPAGLREAELAAHVGAPPFKLRMLGGQLRHWDPDRLSRALQVVAAADLDVKGAAADREYSVERMVIRVASLRRR